jgi:tetratricopeptide (TPR) repeat protein
MANDPNVLLGAYLRRANTLYYRKRFTQQLQNYRDALHAVNIETASPLIQGRVYSGYAGILCKFDGNKQEALRYDGLAHDVFPDNPEDDPSFTFNNAAHYVINLNSMVVHLDLGNPKAAETALIKAAQGVPKTANPRYIELLNHHALVAIAMNDLEQSCTHIETVAALGSTLGSDLYRSDARNIISSMPDQWKRARRVKDVLEILNA